MSYFLFSINYRVIKFTRKTYEIDNYISFILGKYLFKIPDEARLARKILIFMKFGKRRITLVDFTFSSVTLHIH